ncbi:MAG: NADH-quinone oxidoreductase subunit NuoE [Alsobacter sp.]
MSVRRLAADAIQPKDFAFTPENQAWATTVIAKYPAGRQASAVIPLLWRAQEQHDYWLPKAAIEHVAGMLGMPNIRVLEVATFYTMFNLEPVGRHFIQLCGTTPCRLRGAEDIIKVCRERIGEQRHVTADGLFSWLEVECLGACCNAPMVQINNDYYEDLTPESFNKLLDDLAAGRPVKKGPQNGRHASEPEGDVKTLTDPALYDGSLVGAWQKRFAEEEAKAREAAAAKEAADRAEAAKAVENPEPAKPAPTQPALKAADTPAARVADGKEPVHPAEKAKAADATTSLTGTVGVAPQTPPAVAATQPVLAPVSDEHKPELLAAPKDGKPDDLELIWGVGPKLAELLHKLGVFHFAQIASWNELNLRWIDQNLGAFKGRAVRDKWIEQAAKLASGWRPEKPIGDKPQG